MNKSLNTKIVFISHFDPSPIGNGGNHRSYQIQEELKIIVGNENVKTLFFPLTSSQKKINYWLRRKSDKVFKILKRPFQIFLNGFQGSLGISNLMKLESNNFLEHWAIKNSIFFEEYKAFVNQTKQPIICIIDIYYFEHFLGFNENHSIPTFICPHNIESFDDGIPLDLKKLNIYSVSQKFAMEFQVFTRCNERFMISKLEKGLIEGLGLPSIYFPYLPIGTIRDRLIHIRNSRFNRTQDERLFLLIGSANHRTTEQSMIWFIENAKNFGLPSNIKVKIIGSGTNELIPLFQNVESIEVLGWVQQDMLDQLLIQSKAILIPQKIGFGAISRLSETACAGIPIITSDYATLAVNSPPNTYIAEDWNGWFENIKELANKELTTSLNDYEDWEKNEPREIERKVSEYL